MIKHSQKSSKLRSLMIAKLFCLAFLNSQTLFAYNGLAVNIAYLSGKRDLQARLLGLQYNVPQSAAANSHFSFGAQMGLLSFHNQNEVYYHSLNAAYCAGQARLRKFCLAGNYGLFEQFEAFGAKLVGEQFIGPDFSIGLALGTIVPGQQDINMPYAEVTLSQFL